MQSYGHKSETKVKSENLLLARKLPKREMGVSANPSEKPGNFMHYLPFTRWGFEQLSYQVSFPGWSWGGGGLWEGRGARADVVQRWGTRRVQHLTMSTCSEGLWGLNRDALKVYWCGFHTLNIISLSLFHCFRMPAITFGFHTRKYPSTLPPFCHPSFWNSFWF